MAVRYIPAPQLPSFGSGLLPNPPGTDVYSTKAPAPLAFSPPLPAKLAPDLPPTDAGAASFDPTGDMLQPAALVPRQLHPAQTSFGIDKGHIADNQMSSTSINDDPGTPVNEPTIQEELGAGSPTDPLARKAMEALYGATFPLLQDQPSPEAWAVWASNLWEKHASGVQPRLHMVEKNRLMRKGIQWLSEAFGRWREPPKPRETTRAVDNMIAPSLDQRTQIICDQRPGFRTKPENQEQRNLKKAEAQQVALEYQYDQQQISEIIREGSYWNGTDGVSFLHVHWDPDAGPWDEVFVPLHGQPEGPEDFTSQRIPLGDVRTKVLRIEQVRVSAEASANRVPSYWLIRETIPTAQAVRDHGTAVVDGVEPSSATDGSSAWSGIGAFAVKSGTQLPDYEDLMKDQDTIDRYTIYCERSEYLKEGLTLVVLGRKVVAGPMPLICGMVPLVRFTDGSSDPSFYPQACMEDWADAQVRINSLLSKWVDSVRLNAGGRFLAKENAISSETLIGGMMSVVGVKGPGDIRNTVQPVPGFSVGQDLLELIAREKKALEDRSGWNDASRGSFSADSSGRAILAQREALERTFAPCVNAASQAMEGWCKITLAWMAWGYDYPRTVSMEGPGRPDLVRELTSEDMDGISNVTIDPETLMPMPRALKLFLLDSMLQKGAMSMQEYRRRLPFAFTQDIDSPDTDQQARAKRVAESIRSGQPALPMLWMDDEAIHQDVLERELILPDDLDPNIRAQAFDRWMQLAQQSQAKMGPPPGPPQPGGHGPGSAVVKHGMKPKDLPAKDKPMQGTNPGISAGTAAQMSGASDEQKAGVQADALSHQ